MCGLIAEIIGGEQPGLAHLALYAEVPLLHVRCVNVERQIGILSARHERGILGRWKRLRKRIAPRVCRKWIAEPAGRIGESYSAGPRRAEAEAIVYLKRGDNVHESR